MSNLNVSQRSLRAQSALSTNKVLRNTYALLSVTLIFSAFMAMVSTMMNVGYGASLA
ncbi:MAG: BAX inhibitor (BI)-1/YccA family protein, partial [Gammaproteobacteria bacterium]|nr:BAX inhibitor (BI)-1/YccA family protein [Gammaproteobacteria bacterium]